MFRFLAELYEPSPGTGRDRLRAAAERQGSGVRWVDSIHVPPDETTFVVVEAQSMTAVERLAGSVGLRFTRVVEL
jgi:hypothetical protein